MSSAKPDPYGEAAAMSIQRRPAEERQPEVESSIVFERFESDHYHSFRGPLSVRTPNGTLLAFAAGKIGGAGDFIRTDMVLKRSTDGGRTWGEIEVVATDAPHRVMGSVVVDEATGRVVVVVVRIVLDAPPGTLPRAFVLHSDDDGRTWSEWAEVTEQVALPDWEHFVIGPPHGIQLRNGAQAGRLVFPGWFRRLPPQDGNPVVGGAYLAYSDDGGKSWQIGAIDERGDGVVNPDESAVVELSDGTLYVNTRNQRALEPEHRASARSDDGGESFSVPFRTEPRLVTPLVSASMLQATRRGDPSERIVFCSEDHPSSRDRLMLWASLDGADSWHESLLVYDGPAGYTDLVTVDDTTIGVLAETGPRVGADGGLSYFQWLRFTRVPLVALDRPPGPRPVTPDASGHGRDAGVSGRPRVVPGAIDTALELAGEYVEVPLVDELLLGDGPMTVAVWFRTASDADQRIAHAYNYDRENPQWSLDITDQRVHAVFTTDVDSVELSAAEDYIDGQWHHVALRRGNDNHITLFVDGRIVGSTGPVAGSVSADALAPVRLGARVDGINNPLIGAVDDLVLYRRALSDSSVAGIVEGEPPPRDDHLLVHLPLNGYRE